MRLLIVLMLVCSVKILTAQKISQDWKNLLEDNVISFISESGYVYTGKVQEGAITIYRGSKDLGLHKIEFYFVNKLVRGLEYVFEQQYPQAPSPIRQEYEKIIFNEFKAVVKEKFNLEGRGLKFLQDNDSKLETEWYNHDDGKQQYIVKKVKAGDGYKISAVDLYLLNEKVHDIFGLNIVEIDTYDLDYMVRFFLRDAFMYAQKKFKLIANLPSQDFYNDQIFTEFTGLDGDAIAVALGFNLENKIIINVDPIKWKKSNAPTRWYILYHELGHDKFNLVHGDGGRMMFNYIDQKFTWEQFLEDRAAMFDKYFYQFMTK